MSDESMTGASAYVGYQPIVKVRTIEQTKYETMWGHPQYRTIAPGEDIAPLFLQQARPKHGAEVIDFGAGTGRGALWLALFGGLKVHMLDFAANCLDEDIRPMLQSQAHALTFIQHDLTKPVPLTARYGFCTDVMEHIPPADVSDVLRNVLKAAQHVFFQISCVDDSCGSIIGDTLHLSVHDYAWWLKRLQDFDCTVHWSRDLGTSCLFYVSAWQRGDELLKYGVLNVETAELLANVEANLAGGWQELRPYEVNDLEVLLLGGGPSLSQFTDEIKERRAAGAKLVTLNGAYNWALDNGLVPSAQIVVDARAHNSRFTHPPVEECRYLLASQVHPSVLEGLPKERTYLWHTTMPEIRELLNRERQIWYAVPGGSTVALRAIPLLRMLGYKKFRCYGLDSCLIEDQSHAYAQAENDRDYVVPVTCGDKVFRCTVWQASQAHEFMDLIKVYGDEVELEVYGPGLLAHILETGAAMADAEGGV